MGRYKIKTVGSAVIIEDKDNKRKLYMIKTEKPITFIQCEEVEKRISTCKIIGTFDIKEIPEKLYSMGIPPEMIGKAVKRLKDLDVDLLKEIFITVARKHL